MTHKSVLSFLTLFVLLSTAPARAAGPDPAAAIAPYIDEQTLVVVRIDLAALDIQAARQWLDQTLKTGRDAAQAGQVAPIVDRGFGALIQWRDDFRKAGGHDLCFVFGLNDASENSGFLLATLDANANAKAVGELMESGPHGAPPANLPHSYGIASRARQIGNVVIYAAPATLEHLKHFTPAPRPELAQAFAQAGDAPVQAALIPSDDLVRVAEALAPKLPPQLGGGPMSTLTHGVRWASLAIQTAPKMAANLVIQSQDADAARALDGLINLALSSVKQHEPGGWPAGLSKLAESLTPQVAGDRLTLALNADQLASLSSLAVGRLKIARRQARRLMSMNNMRQLLLASLMYVDKHSQWPDSLEQAAREATIDLNMLSDPDHPSTKPGYIYRKPLKPTVAGDAKAVVLYENYDKWNGGINVGFADGHVEFWADEAGFKKLLK
ncbi:MAG TPA: H-X9-DG-CTERM domain-containing protein [Tepidisphaeraceae bacterium]|nr:H-X9-DG-CTERM domain-containing protein [Tepidisphaeraceae bacterium]